jgi:hypothetical protein
MQYFFHIVSGQAKQLNLTNKLRAILKRRMLEYNKFQILAQTRLSSTL